ncbi:MAG: hypothetical protein JNK49_09845 [Planctomycetes bacterium]|nr:hypothetical protein [Planctomycetota bacterium]
MNRIFATLALSLFAAPGFAQDFIHYKFDSTCTNEVINYATGPQALGANGTLQSNSTISPWTSGTFGGALAGGANAAPTYYNRVVTGWNPSTQPVTGALTMAWFMRQRPGSTLNTSLSYLSGAPTGGFRLFTNGIAGRGLYQREIFPSGGNGNNAPRDFVLPVANADIQTLAATNWVHVAIVIDPATSTADWYVNGTSVLQITGVPGASITLAGPFMLGAYTTAATGAGSLYDMDEFLMSFRAYTPGEILALSLAPQAGDGDYTSGTSTQCGSLALASSGGRPFLGNTGYALEVTPAAPSFYAILFGLNRCTYAGVFPLPLDGGLLAPIATGCQVLTDNLLNVGGLANGPTAQPFAIPTGSGFAGLGLYSQAVAIDLSSLAVSASNGFVIGIGN